jgi:hypothetical protein
MVQLDLSVTPVRETHRLPECLSDSGPDLRVPSHEALPPLTLTAEQRLAAHIMSVAWRSESGVAASLFAVPEVRQLAYYSSQGACVNPLWWLGGLMVMTSSMTKSTAVIDLGPHWRERVCTPRVPVLPACHPHSPAHL